MRNKFWIRAAVLLIVVAMLAGVAACGGDGGKTDVSSDKADTGSDEANVTSYDEAIIGGDDDEQPTDEPAGDEPAGDASDSTADEQSGTNNNNNGSTASTGKTDNTASQASSGVKDMKGRIFTIALYSEGTKAAFTDAAEGIYADSIREIAKKYNCKFKIVTVPILDLIAQVEQDAMSGTATWDATQVEGYHVVPKQCKTGYYICMSDYYNFNDGVWNGSYAEKLGVFVGKRYALPLGMGGDMGLFYNKNLVKAANLPDPWTYVDNKTWNWDTFKSFIKALTKDTDGDGQPNQFGYINDHIAVYTQLIMTNGAQVVDLSSGQGKLGINSAAAKEAINFALTLYEEGLIPDSDQIEALGLGDAFHAMATGKVATYSYGAAYGPWLVGETGMDWDDLGWTYLPKGPSAKDYVSPTATPPSMLMIERYAKDPADTVLALQDVMAFWSPSHKSKMTVDQMRTKNAQEDYIVDFLQGRHLEVWNRGPEIESCINILSYTDALELLRSMFYEISTKKYTVQAGIDAYKDAIQAAITDLEKAEVNY